jgi:hypothetical protein
MDRRGDLIHRRLFKTLAGNQVQRRIQKLMTHQIFLFFS